MLLLVLGGFFGSSESSEFLKKNEKRNKKNPCNEVKVRVWQSISVEAQIVNLLCLVGPEVKLERIHRCLYKPKRKLLKNVRGVLLSQLLRADRQLAVVS